MHHRIPILAAWLLVIPAPGHAGSGELASLVQDIGICVVLAGVLAILFGRIRIPEIAAFLVAGIVAGPTGAGLITDPVNIETIAELGLILLLFVIGLEIDLRKLLSSGKILMVTGILQYPLSVALGFMVIKLLAWSGLTHEPLLGGAYTPLYVGFVLAASSTLLVVKLFQESFQLDTEAGRISLGLLIFQDIWAIAVIAVQDSFEAPGPGSVLPPLAGIAMLGLVAVLFARHVIPIGFRWIAKMPEVIFLGALSWCFMVIFLGANLDTITREVFGTSLDFSVGPGMAALVAGVSIASLPYSTEIIGKVNVVKDFFVTLFFVGLGMSIPAPGDGMVLVLACVLALLALLVRYVVFFPLLYFSGLDRRNAMVVSTRLAQVSEFSLVIAFIGMKLGHISSALNSSIILAFIITALLTPVLFRSADAIHDRLGPLLTRLGFRLPPEKPGADGETYEVAILGFHRVASSLLHELAARQPHVIPQTLVVDLNVGIHSRIADAGVTVKYGDLSNAETLQHAGVDRARVVVCSVADNILKGTSTRKVVEAVRRINPDAVIIANAIELAESRRLYESGADYVYMERIEAACAVSDAIDSGLAGDISVYREARVAAEGEWHTRREIL